MALTAEQKKKIEEIENEIKDLDKEKVLSIAKEKSVILKGKVEELVLLAKESGKPVVGRGEIRSGLLEQSNVDLKANMSDYQQAKVQMELVKSLIKTNRELLQSTLELAT